MKNGCKITFEGLNVNRVLSLLCKQGIPLGEITRRGKICALEVPSTRYKQTIAILRERCYNIIGIEFFGIPKFAKFVKKHCVLPVICALLALTLVISSRICLKIEVSGDYDRQTVCDALAASGVTVGTDLHKIDMSALQNRLANELGSMYAVIKRSGSVLYVNAVAKKDISPPIDMSSRRDIVASRAGVVTKLVCEQGSALVKIGDSVNVGDVLIRGCRTFNDGTSEDVYALGRVTLRISASGFAFFDGTKELTVETGRQFKAVGVMLFGRQYVADCPFETYTVDASVTRLFPLNLAVCVNVYRETALQKVPATLDECLEELKQTALSDAMSHCDFAVTETVYETTDRGVCATLYGEVAVN